MMSDGLGIVTFGVIPSESLIRYQVAIEGMIRTFRQILPFDTNVGCTCLSTMEFI